MKIKSNKPPKVKPVNDPDDLPTDVKQLQAELGNARLLIELLAEVINTTEEELGRPIRKKSGQAILKAEQCKSNLTILDASKSQTYQHTTLCSKYRRNDENKNHNSIDTISDDNGLE